MGKKLPHTIGLGVLVVLDLSFCTDQFNGAFPQYVEVDEEFRLYHDLAEDKIRQLLLAFDAQHIELAHDECGSHEVHRRFGKHDL